MGPFGKDFVDRGVVDFGFAALVFGHGQALPLHTGVEHPQDEVEDAVIAEFALGPTSGDGEVRQDKLIELDFRQLHGNGRSCGLLGRHGHDGMALFEEGSVCLGETLSSNRIIPEVNRQNF
jgi:hypothetical protein